MNTTTTRVRAIARHLANMPPEILAIYIEDAVDEVSKYRITSAVTQERLQRYYAAHLATLDRRRASSQKASDLQLTYQAAQGEGLRSTEYGQEYQRLLKQTLGGYLKVM